MTLTKRLFIVNFAGACIAAWAWWLGYVGFVYSHDISRISYVITALFAASIAAIFAGRTAHIERSEVWLVTLGLIGNVIGFIIALQHIDTGSLGSAEGVQKVAASLLAGMGVAFCSTLVGAVAALWISVNGWVVGAAK
ncbi:MotA/TolQ/ExbB proton channel family protein [Mesorhizobium sp. ESP-6-4]|uniref:MotA/TolQ/ExbB proton channel family protein n=1 Tax=Mesorhizobium sp. ESP-6-4 TaxID=2876624 RepID=UPI001CCC8E8C|nr:MotA/TolQ/ExbB proton channel family protein [Mesorhizobium sp. ESP-6-4]MBZ9659754.1 MotA/TolQ/ExbB proton channel family protein [Mesorhizobium sp. ESP-6-4]